MLAHSGSRHLDTPLDPSLPGRRFHFQTNWHVITGAPCCGKTTLVELLASSGYTVVEETARPYITDQVAQGRSLEDNFANPQDEYVIHGLQCQCEAALDPAQLLFLDRAVPDALAFFRIHDLDPNDVLVDCLAHRYRSVFLLQRLPLEVDSARLDDERLAKYLERWHTRDYEALGYEVTHVPLLPAARRLEWVLSSLSSRGLLHRPQDSVAHHGGRP